MKKHILFFMFLGLGHFITAQVLYKDTLPAYKNSVKIAPFNVVDIVTPNVEVSYERLLSNNYSAQVSLAYILDENYLFYNTEELSSSGFKIKLEGRRNVNISIKGRENTYMAIEATHLYQEEKIVKDFGGCNDCPLSNPLFPNYYKEGYKDTIKLYRNMTALNMKFGIQSTFSEHFFLDFYFGLGIKFRDVRHSERIDERDDITYDSHHPQSRRDDARKSLVPSIPVNLKLGYRF